MFGSCTVGGAPVSSGSTISINKTYSAGHHDLHQSKTLISPSNVAQNANPGTVLETARPEDSKTPPTC